jgi:hypothetical protein
MKIARQQSDLARRADPVHKETLIDRQRCRGGQLKEPIITKPIVTDAFGFVTISSCSMTGSFNVAGIVAPLRWIFATP